MISVGKAQKLVVEKTRPLATVRVPTGEAMGRVATRDVTAPIDLPRFASASMDGYAVSSRDTRGASHGSPAKLRLVRRRILAGSKPGLAVPDGAAVRIMTGAPLPTGVDAVIAQEDARIERGALWMDGPLRAGTNVRRVAEDCRKGEKALAAGTLVQPGVVALLAALGVNRIEVRRPPRVAIVVTGNEVRRPTARSLPEWAVRDSHAAFLRAALQEFRIRPALVSYARDRVPDIRRRIARALDRADLVIVTGGVSVGERDLVRPVLSALGVRTVFWGVAQRPGKPLYFGTRGNVAVFGLPGNPASTIVCYCEYVRPAIRKMLGYRRCYPEEWAARLATPIRPAGGRTRFLRGRLTMHGGAWAVSVARRQASHMLGAFVGSDCLVVVPARVRGSLEVRSQVRVHPFPWRKP